MKKKFKLTKEHLIRLISTTLLLAIITLLIYLFANNNARTITSLVDGLLISGFLGITLSLFCLLIYSGTLNFFSYGFKSLGDSIFRKGVREYKDLTEYNNVKREKYVGKTLYFLLYLIPSLLFILASIIIYLIIY